MNNRTFSEKEFHAYVFGPERPFNKDFLKEWNNNLCIYHTTMWTPVEWAAMEGYLDIVKFLVENGADIILDCNHTIYMAIKFERIYVIKYLLSTNIYTEKSIHNCKSDNSDIHDLLVNYKQFSNTKACR